MSLPTRRSHGVSAFVQTDMNKGNTRLVLFESPDAMYLAVRGPKENQADHLLKTNRLDASDDVCSTSRTGLTLPPTPLDQSFHS